MESFAISRVEFKEFKYMYLLYDNQNLLLLVDHCLRVNFLRSGRKYLDKFFGREWDSLYYI